MASKNIITDKVVIDNLAGNGNVEVDVNQGQTIIKADAIELTGTLTNNGQPISGGGGSTVTVTQVVSSGTKIATVGIDGTDTDLYAPTAPTVNDGKLSITINGNTQFSQGFGANQSGNVNASLTTGLVTNYSTSSTPVVTPFLFLECRNAVTSIALSNATMTDFSTNEYACTFTPSASSVSVTLSGYTINWLADSEVPTSLDTTKSYIMSVIAPKNGSSFTNAYGIIKIIG